MPQSPSPLHALPQLSGGMHVVKQSAPRLQVEVMPPQPEQLVGKQIRVPVVVVLQVVPAQQSASVEHALRQQEGLLHFAVQVVKSTSQPTAPHALHDAGMHLPEAPHTVPLQQPALHD